MHFDAGQFDQSGCLLEKDRDIKVSGTINQIKISKSRVVIVSISFIYCLVIISNHSIEHMSLD